MKKEIINKFKNISHKSLLGSFMSRPRGECFAFAWIKLSIITILFVALYFVPSRLDAQSITWATATVPDYKNIKDVSYSKELGRYVAVGLDSAIYWSNNGLTWNKAQNFNIQCDLNCTAYAFGKFYAGGKSAGKAILLESEDGINWFNANHELRGINYDEEADEMTELETVTGDDGLDFLVSITYVPQYKSKDVFLSESKDGSTWLKMLYQGNEKISGLYKNSKGYLFNESHASGFYGSKWYYKPNDSSNYSKLQSGWYLTDIPQEIKKLVYGNGVYVGAGSAKKLGYLDGKMSWVASATTIASTDFTGAAFGAGYFVAVGTNGAAAASYDDGRSWVTINQIRSAFDSLTINGVDFLNDRFIAYGDGGGIAIGTPVNNREWGEASLPSGTKSVTAIAVNDQRAVAVSLGGKIYHSTDGQNWTLSRPVTSNNLNNVIYDTVGKVFIATGEKGTVLRSSDGISWSSSATGSTSSLQGAARLGKSLYAMGPAQAIMESTNNGTNWRRISSTQITRPVVEVSASGGVLFAVADRGTCFVSNKGNDFWKARPINGMTGAAYGGAAFNGNYYIVGEKGQIFSTKASTAATATRVNWSKIPTNTSYNLRDVAPNGDVAKQFAAVGDGGTVYRRNFSNGSWGIERINDGAPQLRAIVWYPKGKVWLVAGNLGSNGAIYYTSQK